MSLSGINKDKKRCQDRASHRTSVGFYPHPYASVSLQVQRVKALRAQSQLTSSAPLVVVTSEFNLNTFIVRKARNDYNLFHT